MKKIARFSCTTGPEIRCPSGACAPARPMSESIINGEAETAVSKDQRMQFLPGIMGGDPARIPLVHGSGWERQCRNFDAAVKISEQNRTGPNKLERRPRFERPGSGLELQARQPRVETAGGGEFLVRALLDDAAGFHYQDTVAGQHRRQAMR